MNRFLTLFPNAKNIHLVKDVGMIPYHLYKEFNYCSGIASFKNGDYPYLDSEVEGLKQYFVKRIFKNEQLNVCWFILTNFWKWDILQCYHISKESVIYLNLFKFLKTITFSSSITYLKFDSNDFIKKTKLNKLYIFVLRKIKILSVESKNLYDFYNAQKLLNGKVEYIPNGFEFHTNKRINYCEKENLFITVGRIGHPEKNNQILLESFVEVANINLNWKLELVGPIEDDFNIYIDNFFKKYPKLVSRVKFTGNISDRIELQKKFNSAKIFILTSPMEGFPLVYLEAIRSGCSIISPSFSSALDVTNQGLFGELFELNDFSNLTELMLKLSSNHFLLEQNCALIQNYAFDNFTWTKICNEIDLIIKSKY